VREVGGIGIGANQFSRPSDVTAKLGLDILVADAGNDRIQRFNRRLGYISTTKKSDAFTEPLSLDVSEFGDLFILDGSRRRVVKINALVSQLVFFGGVGSGSGELEDPKDVDVKASETVTVADGSTGDVVQFDLFGNFLASYHIDDDADVCGVASDEKYVWVAANDRVGYINQRGKFILCLSKSDLEQLGITSADDIAVSKQHVIVLDSSGGKIWWFLKQESSTK
jgi:DNA-binding beta-propeller fold protein YncE